VRNILATSAEKLPALRSTAATIGLTAGIAAGIVGAGAWGVWTTQHLLALEKREVVTVQLARIMGDFVEGEARSGRSPDETKRRVEIYLKAVDASVQSLGSEGRTVLVAEAVVAGSAHDMTDAVRRDVAKRVGSLGDARP
jgi:hypothetical protein